MTGRSTSLRLTKHTALGNDFLVLLDLEDRVVVDAGLARAVCDRRFGVGADGLIKVTAGAGGADVTMELRNRDGGAAEMSGNGIRCLGQAVVDAGLFPGPDLVVATGGGIRHLSVQPESEPGLRFASVDMGPARVTESDDGLGARSARVDTGNPHLVVLDPEAELDLIAIGRAHADLNVELIEVTGADHLRMRVHERGAGETLACGTGSCASAAAAHEWGLVGTSVIVTNPGGDVTVDIKPDTLLLSGPTRLVATVELPFPLETQ
jgi:diaminopimelate epimerase